MNSSLQQLQTQISAAVAGWSEEQLSARRGDKWSAGEILEHLLLTYEGTTRALERCLDSGKTLATRPTLRQRLITFALLTTRHMPEGRKSPERALPKGRPVMSVAGQIAPQVGIMDAAMARCENKFGRHTKVLDHPVLGALTVNQWRSFHCIHGKHHLQQLARLHHP
ncbi:MAG: DinB family protein [Acidobacteriales bacterium]|nr:DinB family protein [Terriglobales bacterium]